MIKTRFDKRVKWITVITTLVMVIVGAWVCWRSGASFLPAWITILTAAVFLLIIMSIPKGIVVTEKSVEIHCLVELTNIEFKDITSVKMVGKRDLKPCWPLLGVFGFFGYYGFYFSFSRREGFRLYAKSWNNLIMIERNDQQRFVISVDDQLEFIKRISKYMK